MDIVGWRPSIALRESGLVKSQVPVPVPAEGGGADVSNVEDPYSR